MTEFFCREKSLAWRGRIDERAQGNADHGFGTDVVCGIKPLIKFMPRAVMHDGAECVDYFFRSSFRAT